MSGTMRQSAALVADEAEKRSMMDNDVAKEDHRFIHPVDGDISIEPIEMVGDWVAVAPMPPETRTSGGLLLPGSARPETGIVLGVGNEAAIKLPNLAIGQVVKFAGNANNLLTNIYPFYGETHIWVYRSSGIIAILPQPTDIRMVMSVETGPIGGNANTQIPPH